MFALAGASQSASAVVIDNFSEGPIVLATSGETFDEAETTQLGLSPSNVITGSRSLNLVQGAGGSGDPSLPDPDNVEWRVESDGSGLSYITDAGISAITSFVRYESEEGVDFAPAGENTLLLRFDFVDFDGLPQGGRAVGALDIGFQSEEGFDSLYLPLRNTGEPVDVAIDLSLLTEVDVRNLTDFSLGTSNGNLVGSFKLSGIETVALVEGDYNADGAVNAADYTVWRDGLAAPGSARMGDGNNDGSLDELDLQVWRDNFGLAAVSSGAVPEPSAAAVGCTATLLLSVCVRRFR
ncbi:MAG: hypothetical protein AAF266_12460 [Planctomycetota bacterium]